MNQINILSLSGRLVMERKKKTKQIRCERFFIVPHQKLILPFFFLFILIAKFSSSSFIWKEKDKWTKKRGRNTHTQGLDAERL